MGAAGGGARAIFLALPLSTRGSEGCGRPEELRHRGRDAQSATAATVMLGRERTAMVAGEGGGGQ